MKIQKEHNTTLRNASRVALALGLTASTYGAGFQLAERSTIGLGRAYSGEAAIADDASVVASNPAGMTLLEGSQITVGTQAIFPSVEVEATNRVLAAGGAPNSTLTADNAAPEVIVVPNLYFTHKVNDKWSIGLGSFASYGLKTDYSGDVIGLIAADHSEIFSATVNPSIAYQVTDQLSVGAGLNMTYVKGKISSGSATAVNPATGSPINTFGFSLAGDDFAFSYNVGVLYQPFEGTRIGLHYRSAIDLEIEGEATVGPELNPLLAGDYDATLATTLPDTLEFSVYQEVTDRLAIHGDVFWTFWSKFDELAPKVGNSTIDTILATPENWNDSYRISIGATYQATDELTLRAGFAWDKSPVEDEYRTFRIPDAERYWVAVGASYAVNEHLVLDTGYTHIFVEEAVADEEFAFARNSGGIDIFGVGATYKF